MSVIKITGMSGHFDFNEAAGGPEYTAAQFAEYQQMLVGSSGSGYYAGYLEECKVTATGEGMSVIVNPGGWIIEGYYLILKETARIEFTAEAAGSSRIDTVVVRKDLSTDEAEMYITVVAGTSTTGSPVAPALEQTDLVYEAPLCDVLVAGGANISVTDRRTMIAGAVAPTVDYVRDYCASNAGSYRSSSFVQNAGTKYCYVTVLNPENATAIGLPAGTNRWAKIIHLAHSNDDGFATQIAMLYAAGETQVNRQILTRTATANQFSDWVTSAQVVWYTGDNTPPSSLPAGTLVLRVV